MKYILLAAAAFGGWLYYRYQLNQASNAAAMDAQNAPAGTIANAGASLAPDVLGPNLYSAA